MQKKKADEDAISGPAGQMLAQSGVLDDVHVTSYPRLNALILSAPPQTMHLLEELIKTLDVPPQAKATVRLITLRRADATATANIILQVFLGVTPSGAAPTAADECHSGTSRCLSRNGIRS